MVFRLTHALSKLAYRMQIISLLINGYSAPATARKATTLKPLKSLPFL
jgi:hypothetical protein